MPPAVKLKYNEEEAIEKTCDIILSYMMELDKEIESDESFMHTRLMQRVIECISWTPQEDYLVYKNLQLTRAKREIYRQLYGRKIKPGSNISSRSEKNHVMPYIDKAFKIMGLTLVERGYKLPYAESTANDNQKSASRYSIYSIRAGTWTSLRNKAYILRWRREYKEISEQMERAVELGVGINDLPENAKSMLFQHFGQIKTSWGEILHYPVYRSRKNQEHERFFSVFTGLPADERVEILTELTGKAYLELDITNCVPQRNAIEGECRAMLEQISSNSFFPDDPNDPALRKRKKKHFLKANFSLKSDKEYTERYLKGCLTTIKKMVGSDYDSYIQALNDATKEELFSLEGPLRVFAKKNPQVVHVHDAIYIPADETALIKELETLFQEAGIIYKPTTHALKNGGGDYKIEMNAVS